jgi:hypothetical protein
VGKTVESYRLTLEEILSGFRVLRFPKKLFRRLEDVTFVELSP